MNGERPTPEPKFRCSSDETTNTSLSSGEIKEKPSHVVNFRESKTHLFYVIQSDDERNEKTQRFIRIKISKERSTPPTKFVSRKMLVRHDETQEKTKRAPKPNLSSIYKRTDHPSFVVLPEVISKRRGNIERNQSTSDNSNETYVIRPREENKIFGSKVPTLIGPSLWNRNSRAVETALLHGLNVDLTSKKKSEDFCECDNAGISTRKCNTDWLNLNKNKIETMAKKASPAAYLKKGDLFNIHFVESSNDQPQRLRAGQDCDDRRYKSCYMCPDITRIFPPTSSRRQPEFQSFYSDSSLKNRGGHVKINFKLVRQCLISAKPNEKCDVLDAIRLRMKTPDFNLAMNTIEEIVKFDLFGVQCECRSKPLLEELFWPINAAESYQLQSSIAQFVNALVCYKVGRNYFHNRSVIRMLTWGEIGRDNLDPIMVDNLIGIMMKLSCSRFQRSDMIENGLVRWLLRRMEEDEYSSSKYRVQCMAGLLRNLLRGYNLDDLSPIEMQRLIVLLGRYLDTDNIIAKRYICDALLAVFQSMKHVTSAKELNFQRIIEEHVKSATHPKQKEHLRAVHQLLNRSATTSKSFNNQKFDSQSEEDPYLDVDLESDVSEVDYYPGEFLLREKFSDELETHRYDKNSNESPPSVNDHGTLVSRVFVEHLNCFLPNIENNRIFPLCNSRCADKIRTCSHIGGVQPKKRQPYIPPNSRASRLPRQQHSDSVQGMHDEDYKLKKQSKPPDARLQSTGQGTTKFSTISHDKSAVRWDHYEDDDNQKFSKSDAGTMERIFLRDSMTTVEATDVNDMGTLGGIKKESADELNDTRERDESVNEKLVTEQRTSDTENVTQSDRGTAVVGGISYSDDYQSAKERLDSVISSSGTKNTTRNNRKATDPAKTTKSVEDLQNAKRERDSLKSRSVGELGHAQKKIVRHDASRQSKLTPGGTGNERVDADFPITSKDTESADKLNEKGKNDETAEQRTPDTEYVTQSDCGTAVAGRISYSDDYQSAKEELDSSVSSAGTKNTTRNDRKTTDPSSAKTAKSVEDLQNAKRERDSLKSRSEGELGPARKKIERRDASRESVTKLTPGATGNERVDADFPITSKDTGSAYKLNDRGKNDKSANEKLAAEQRTPDAENVTQNDRGTAVVVISSSATKNTTRNNRETTDPAKTARSVEDLQNDKRESDSLKSRSVGELGPARKNIDRHDGSRKSVTESGGTGNERVDVDVSVDSKGDRSISHKSIDEKLTTDRQSPDTKNMARNDRGMAVVGERTGTSSSVKVATSEEDFRSTKRERSSLNSKSADALGLTRRNSDYQSSDGRLGKDVSQADNSRQKIKEHEDMNLDRPTIRKLKQGDKVSDSRLSRSGKVLPIARHHSDNSITQQSMAAMKLTKIGEKKIGGDLHARSEEIFTNLAKNKEKSNKAGATKTTQKNVFKKEIGSESPDKAEKILANAGGENPPTIENNQQLLNVRSEETLKKMLPVSTAKEDPDNKVTKTHQLHARSLEKFQHPMIISPRSKKKSKPTREADLDLKSSETRPIARRFSEASVTSIPTKQTNISVDETGGKIHARSAENLANYGDANAERLSSSFMEVNETQLTNFAEKEVGRELHAGSEEILSSPKAAEKSKAGKSPIPNPRSVDALTSDRKKLPNPRSVEAFDRNEKPSPVKTVKELGVLTHQLHARSATEIKYTDPVATNVSDDSVLKGEQLVEIKDLSNEDMAGPYGGKSTGKDYEKILHLPDTSGNPQPMTVAKPTNVCVGVELPALSGKVKSNQRTGEKSRKPLNARSEDVLNANTEVSLSQQLQSQSAEELKASKDRKLTVAQGERQLNDELNVERYDPGQSVRTPGKLKQKDVGHILHARSKEMSVNPRPSPSPASKKTNYLLLSSNDSIRSTRNEDYALEPPENEDVLIEKRKQCHQLPARSLEFVNFKRRGRSQSATAALDGLKKSRYPGAFSGYSSRSTRNNSSKGCVDCGDGYVLRARPSQPCDNCKASLTKYPNFVEALTNHEDQSTKDYQLRDIKNTTDQNIKVTWINKTEEKLVTKPPNQGNSNKEKLDHSEAGGKSTETKKDGVGAKQNTSSPKDESRATEKSGNEAEDNIFLAKDFKSNEHSIPPAEIISKERAKNRKATGSASGTPSQNLKERSYTTPAGKQTGEDTINSTRSLDGQPIPLDQKLKETTIVRDDGQHIVSNGAGKIELSQVLTTDETKKRSSVHQQSVGSIESVLNVMPQPTNIPKSNGDLRIDSVSGVPSVQVVSSEEKATVNDMVLSVMDKPIGQVDRSTKREHLLLARSIEMRTVNLNANERTGNETVREEAPTRFVASSNPVTNSKQILSDYIENELNIGKLSEEKEQKIEKVTSGDVEDLNPLKNILPLNGSRSEPSQKTVLGNSSNENLVRSVEQRKSLTIECNMLETENVIDTATSSTFTKNYEAGSREESIDRPSEKRNATQLNYEAISSGKNQLLAAASGIKSQVSETTDSATPASSVRTKDNIIGIGKVKSSQNSSIEVPRKFVRVESLSSKLVDNSIDEAPLADTVAETRLIEDNGKLNESPNITSTMTEKEPNTAIATSSSKKKIISSGPAETMDLAANASNAESVQEVAMNESIPSDHREPMIHHLTSDTVMPNGPQRNQVVRVPNHQLLSAGSIAKGGILIAASVIGGRMFTARSFDIFRGGIPAVKEVTNGRTFTARLIDVARSELVSPQLQRAMMPRMSSTETNGQSNNGDRTEIMDLNGKGTSVSTNETKLSDQQMDNSTCDSTLPEENQEQQNLNSSLLSYETIEFETAAKPTDSLNLESESRSQNLAQTFIQPLQEGQLSPAEANGLQLKSEDKDLITNSIPEDYQMPMAQQILSEDPVILAAPRNNQISLNHSVVANRTFGQGQVLAARSLDNVTGEIAAPMCVETVISETETDSLGRNLPQTLIQPLQEAKDLKLRSEYEISIPPTLSEDPVILIAPQINQIPSLGVSLGKPNHSPVALKTNGQALTARSLDIVRDNLVTPMEAVKSNTEVCITKTNLLPVRSTEMVRLERKRKRNVLDAKKSKNQVEKDVPNKSTQMMKDETVAKRESDGIEFTDSSVQNVVKSTGNKVIGSKVSIVTNEVLIDERNLSAERQIERKRAEINQKLCHDDFHFTRDESERKAINKVRIVNSTCCRQLLNDEELINRLSDKVLEKLFTEIHCCGPKCKSPCGGFNSYYEAKNDNSAK